MSCICGHISLAHIFAPGNAGRKCLRCPCDNYQSEGNTMDIFVNQQSGAAYVRLREPAPGETPQRTRQFAKHGLALEWNGHGELLGIVFAGNPDGEKVKIHVSGMPATEEEAPPLVTRPSHDWQVRSPALPPEER